MVSRHSRPEAFAKVRSTLPDKPGIQAGVIDQNNYQDPNGNLKLRGLEAGPGVEINVADADNNQFVTGETKLVISATGAGGALNLFVYNAPITSNGQTIFPLPFTTTDVHTITINGLESINWNFTLGPATLQFFPGPEGYGLETTDELLVFYKSV